MKKIFTLLVFTSLTNLLLGQNAIVLDPNSPGDKIQIITNTTSFGTFYTSQSNGALYFRNNYFSIMSARPSLAGNTIGVIAAKNYDFNIGNYASGNLNLFADGTNKNIVFSTAESEQMRITGNGNVGIGTTTPISKLHVNENSGNTNVYVTNTGGGNGIYSESISGNGIGVQASALNGAGILGTSFNSYGIHGFSNNGIAGYFQAGSGATVKSIVATGNVDLNGFTKLGDDATAPKIKMKKLTGVSASGVGNPAGVLNVAHGLNQSKIISVNIIFSVPSFVNVPPSYTFQPGYEYQYQISASNIVLINTLNGGNITNKNFTILITYEE